MLQLPFAVDSTYSGPWCDRHELWQKHADVKARLHPSPWPAKSDGTFWIEFEVLKLWIFKEGFKESTIYAVPQ